MSHCTALSQVFVVAFAIEGRFGHFSAARNGAEIARINPTGR